MIQGVARQRRDFLFVSQMIIDDSFLNGNCNFFSQIGLHFYMKGYDVVLTQAFDFVHQQ